MCFKTAEWPTVMKSLSPFSLNFVVTIFLCSCLVVHNSTAIRQHKIRPKPCTNALGQHGTCMFVWECIKTEGKHLGTCADGFLFGSCCGHNESENSIHQNHQIELQVGVAQQSPFPTSTSSTSSPSSTTTIIKDKWKPNQTKPPPPPPPPPSTTTTTTTTESIATMIHHHHHHHHSTKPYTTSQKPWIIYTGKPNPMVTSSTRRPAPPSIFWPLNHTNQPPSMSVSFTSDNSPNIQVTTTMVTDRPLIVQHWNNSMDNEFTVNRVPSSTERPETVTSTTTTTTTGTSEASSDSGSGTVSAGQYQRPSSSAIINDGSKNNDNSTTVKPEQPQCGISQVRPRTKVVGGKNSAFGAWPWQVSVRRISFFGFSSTHRCGGAILNSQWIVTAGHCVDDLLLTQIRIRVGEYDFSSALEPLPHIERGAKRKIVHPKYNFFTYENDLALVQLDKPLQFLPHVAPICLPPDNIELLGRNATVTGWGRLSEGGVLPTVLQEVRVPIISNDKCKNMFLAAGRHEYIPDIFMCAGYDAGGRDSCQGDSGGPLQVQGDDGRWFLAGIISWGIGCGEPSLPGVCTRITKFKQWILSYISEVD